MARTAQEDQFAKGVHKSGGQAFLFRQNEFNDTFTYSDEGVKKANKDQSIEVFKGYCEPVTNFV